MIVFENMLIILMKIVFFVANLCCIKSIVVFQRFATNPCLSHVFLTFILVRSLWIGTWTGPGLGCGRKITQM